ncbi:MAG: branched-chain amino acid ABC transporter permease [Desulfatiglans sp.]|jgi:branched-chain amino acid transport system permease protein|nr:branched-chain amino acid ABC transporter permease [Thermodesulfobacteriota bacterium]MEE4351744.1 branched-chain amino acid ABC transporter permease [Desulfatiglans sp.]
MLDSILFSVFPGIVNGCVYALIGVGFIMIRKTSGVFNLAQGQIVIFGCYIFYSFGVDIGLPIWGSILGSMVVGITLGVLVERGLMRPLYGQPIMASVIITLAFALFLEGILSLGWGNEFLVAPRIFPRGVAVRIMSATISYDQAAIIFFTIVMFALIIYFFRKARMGIAMMAVSEDQTTSQSLGIKVARLVAISWAVACALGALGGILITNISGIHYSMTEIGIKAIAVAIIGGFESFGGLLIAGLLVGVCESLGIAFIDPYVAGGSVREIVAFVLMTIILMTKPYGLFGWEKIERV